MFVNFNVFNLNLVIFLVVLLVILLVIIIFLLFYLDVLFLGCVEVINFGILYEKLMWILFVIVLVLVFVLIVLVGLIIFLGLLIVNLVYELMKMYEYKYILIVIICLSWISLFSV